VLQSAVGYKNSCCAVWVRRPLITASAALIMRTSVAGARKQVLRHASKEASDDSSGCTGDGNEKNYRRVISL